MTLTFTNTVTKKRRTFVILKDNMKPESKGHCNVMIISRRSLTFLAHFPSNAFLFGTIFDYSCSSERNKKKKNKAPLSTCNQNVLTESLERS